MPVMHSENSVNWSHKGPFDNVVPHNGIFLKDLLENAR